MSILAVVLAVTSEPSFPHHIHPRLALKSIFQSFPSHMLPTLLSVKLKYLLTCDEEVKKKKTHEVFIFISASTQRDWLFLRNHQVSLLLSTACRQYVHHGCNDVRTTFFLSLHPTVLLTLSHTPTGPSPPRLSADLRPVRASVCAAVVQRLVTDLRSEVKKGSKSVNSGRDKSSLCVCVRACPTCTHHQGGKL